MNLRNALNFLSISLSLFISLSSINFVYGAGLVIHSAEFGVGKFHRFDNQKHPYGQENTWLPYVLPVAANADRTLVNNNPDGSITIYFLTLEDLLATAAKISQDRKTPISVLNVHGHGMPGGMWFPKDTAQYRSLMCHDWRRAAEGADQENYNQYYSAISKEEVMGIREMGDQPEPRFSCVTGLSAWRSTIAKLPTFKAALAPDVQVHFLSCVVGLGRAGEAFTRGLAELLFKSGSQARIETTINFGLGDWSMPEGMGFWDYLSDEQIARDGSIYPEHREDRELAQKGTIRLATATTAVLLSNRAFMNAGFETQIRGTPVSDPTWESFANSVETRVPPRVRIPGTNAYTLKLAH